jgi:perosamine synthetase
MKPLFSALSPNIESDDLALAKDVLSGRILSGKNESEKLSRLLEKYLRVKRVVAFQSGRMSLRAIIKSFSWPEGSEIIVPGFTCAAAIDPIIWSGMKPVFVDICENLNIDLDQTENHISDKTRGILVQHTFGLPVNMTRVEEIARKYDLKIIEDCAHSLGASFHGKLLGSWGDASFFSFGRDKIISSIFGGIAATNDDRLIERLDSIRLGSVTPKKKWIRQQLRHPLLVNRWVQPYYDKHELGRKILLIFQKTGLLSKAMTKEEKMGIMSSREFFKMPQELAILASNQFSKLDRYHQHRLKIAAIYQKELKNLPILMPENYKERTYLKFSVISENKDIADKLLKYLRQKGIYLYDGWKDSAIVPSDVDLGKMQYRAGLCPIAENVSRRLINLPTHINISEKDALRITEEIKIFFTSL